MNTLKNIGEIQQKVWEAVRKQKNFTITSIEKATKVENRILHTVIGRMVSVEIIEVDRTTKPHLYKVKKDVGHHFPNIDTKGQPKSPTYQDKIWMAIKPLKVFSIKDVMLCAETPLTATRVYFHYLVKAGYLIVSGQDSYATIYSFNRKMDTGLKSPSVIKKSVYDRNLRKMVWQHPSQLNEAGL